MVDLAVREFPGIFRTTRLTARVQPGNTVSAGILSRRGFSLDAVEDGLGRYSRNAPPSD